MSNIVYIQVSIFPIAALLAVMDNLKRDMSFSWRRRCLESIMKLMVCIMIFNVVCWCLNGREGSLAKGILWVGNTAYYVFMLYMAFLWFLYVYDKVTTDGNIHVCEGCSACCKYWHIGGRSGKTAGILYRR